MCHGIVPSYFSALFYFNFWILKLPYIWTNVHLTTSVNMMIYVYIVHISVYNKKVTYGEILLKLTARH